MIRQVVAEQRVDNRHDGAQRHVPTEHPARRFDGDDCRDRAHADIERSVIAGAIRHRFMLDHPVDDARRRAGGEQQID